MLIKLSEEREEVVERPWEHWRRPAVAEEYESRRFHNVKGYLYRWREERAFEYALRGLRPGSEVLDAACGTGRITALLLRNGFRATGCDISRAMMTVARRQLTAAGCAIPFVESNVEHLPYRDKSFDAATCSGLLMHLDADRRVNVLRELARVSRGRLVVQYGCLSTFVRVKARMSGRPAGNVRYPVAEAEMRTDFKRSGLTERARFWSLRGLSSSLIVLLTE
jgi:ubiquinone/menaquinone biosynthesis C-methylase UbiE